MLYFFSPNFTQIRFVARTHYELYIRDRLVWDTRQRCVICTRAAVHWLCVSINETYVIRVRVIVWINKYCNTLFMSTCVDLLSLLPLLLFRYFLVHCCLFSLYPHSSSVDLFNTQTSTKYIFFVLHPLWYNTYTTYQQSAVSFRRRREYRDTGFSIWMCFIRLYSGHHSRLTIV